MNDINELIDLLSKYTHIDDDWCDLEALIDEAYDLRDSKVIAPLLTIFEKYPEHDGHGVFWSIVHVLETYNGYERYLFDSVKRQPSHMGIIMLNRMINSGKNDVGGEDIKELLEKIKNNKMLTVAMRELASKVISFQSTKLQE